MTESTQEIDIQLQQLVLDHTGNAEVTQITEETKIQQLIEKLDINTHPQVTEESKGKRKSKKKNRSKKSKNRRKNKTHKQTKDTHKIEDTSKQQDTGMVDRPTHKGIGLFFKLGLGFLMCLLDYLITEYIDLWVECVQETYPITPETQSDSNVENKEINVKDLKVTHIKAEKPIKLGPKEGDIHNVEFRSAEDEDFVLNQAPKIMKKLMFTQKGWRLFHDRSPTSRSTPIRFYQEREPVPEDKVLEKYEELMKKKDFAISFPTEYDKEWLKRCLRKPISESDCEGFVYVYYKQADKDKKKEDKTMAFKIGRSVNAPKRINHSSKENGEVYETARIDKSKFYKHFEAIIHDYFRDDRVIRDEIKDGKTEWFFKKFSLIERVMRKCKVYLNVVHNDKPGL